MNWKLLLAVVALGVLPAAALAQDESEADLEGAKDHPMVTRFPGFRISDYVVEDYGSVGVPLPGGEKTVEGKRFHFNYRRNESTKAISELQLMRNYENALKKAGGKTRFSDRETGQLVVQVPAGAGSVWVYLRPEPEAGAYDLEVVEEKAMAQEVEADAKVLGDSIATTGKVAVYGIHFDTGKSVVKPESEPVLKEIAKMLQAAPSMKLHVVGHTDNQGSIDSNVKLSRDRANAVIKELAAKHGIAASRLAPAGVGSWCPVASNGNEAGRAKNRRVELVQQ